MRGKQREGDGQERKSILIVHLESTRFVKGIVFSVCTYLLI